MLPVTNRTIISLTWKRYVLIFLTPKWHVKKILKWSYTTLLRRLKTMPLNILCSFCASHLQAFRRPYIVPWIVGALCCETSLCPDTLAASHLNGAVVGLGAVATDAKSKYSSLSPLYDFTPIAVETFGAIGESAMDFFRQLWRRIETTTAETCSFAFLTQRISALLYTAWQCSLLRWDCTVIWRFEHGHLIYCFSLFVCLVFLLFLV